MRIKVERYLNYKNELHVTLYVGVYTFNPVATYVLNADEAGFLRDDLIAALAGPCVDCASMSHMTGSNHCRVAGFDDCDD
jgi:hypothetical protein